MPEKLTRQQIYDRIRATSKDSYILEEMQRLGFWESSTVPTISETLIKTEVELTQELKKFLAQDRRFNNQEALLKEMRKDRMKKAKEKRELTKQKNKHKRTEKAKNWQKIQQQQIIYLGKGVSKGLHKTESDQEILKEHNLPFFDSVVTLAQNMKVELSTLRYLLYQRDVSKINHYYTFEIPKKSGGKRKISAPKTQMKNLQLWVLENVLNNIQVNNSVHGFIKNKSIVTNAEPHVGQDIVINIDLKDFFPTIDFKRVKGLFCKLGYSEQIAILFALLSTQAETEEVVMDGITYYVQKGERFLPQGSPASPAISNLIAYKLDKRIKGLAKKFNFTYTRYADDLSFSTTKENAKNIRKLLYFTNQIIESEGFTVHPDKTHVMRKGKQQKVTGVIVNKKLNVERKQLRRFRALLHNIEINGWKDQKWGKAIHLINAIEGYIHFVSMVNIEKGKQFSEQLKKIVSKQGRPQVQPIQYEKIAGVNKKEDLKKRIDVNKENFIESDKTDWWNIF